MQRVAILGAGDLGLSLKTYLEDGGAYRLAGFLDDARKPGDGVHGAEVIGAAAEASALHRKGAFDRLVYAVGYRDFARRVALFEQLRAEGIPFLGVVHPTAYVHRTARLGEGVHLFPGVIVDIACVLEDDLVLNTGVVLAHHAVVRSHSYFGPAVKVAGFTEIGRACFVGLGASIIEKISVGEGCVVAAGAVVVESAPPHALLAGVPAAVKKRLR